MSKIKVVLLFLLIFFISFFGGHQIGIRQGNKQALDNLFELCYTGAVVVREEKAFGCWPMSDLKQEEKKELDNFKQPWYNRSILSNF